MNCRQGIFRSKNETGRRLNRDNNNGISTAKMRTQEKKKKIHFSKRYKYK